MQETRHQEAVLAALRSLVANWYTVEAVAEKAGLDYDVTADALCDLELARDIEIDEWEDALRVRLVERETPLTEEQKALVEQYIKVPYRVAMERQNGKYLTNQELAQYLCVELINVVKKYDPAESPNFLTFAYPCLRFARKRFYQEMSHLRGYKAGKEYDDKPLMESINFDDPAAVAEFETATAYLDGGLLEVREEVGEMLVDLTNEEAKSLVLTEVYGMTGDEAAQVLNSTRAKVNKAKKAAVENIKTKFEVSDKGEVYVRNVVSNRRHRRLGLHDTDAGRGERKEHLMPKVLLGLGVNWPGKDDRPRKLQKKHPRPCPVCNEGVIAENAYCLFCDAWGQDEKFRLEAKERELKALLQSMAKKPQRVA